MQVLNGYQQLPTDDMASRHDLEVAEDSTAVVEGDGGTKRSLQERHLSMIALAGMIGTGLFLSSGKALAQAGPLGCVLSFALMGTVTASIAYTSAEMSAFKPVEGGFVRHTCMWLDRSSGIVVGWNFWYSMAITMPAEISAGTTLLQFWFPNLKAAIPISIFWVAIMIINFSPVRVYGEFEFYFAFCKIALIIAFIIGGLLLDLGAFSGQNAIGFQYWKPPYPLIREFVYSGAKGRFLGIWSSLISAAFAFGNVQVVAIAGAETHNPRKAIPKALKNTFFRVVIFYLISIFVIALTIPANEPRLSGTQDITHSPFVLAFRSVGVKALPSVINAIVITSAFSSGNACTFLASRTLHGLALDGHAPSIFLKLNRYQVPYVSVGVSVIWGVVAYASLHQGAYQAFIWLVSLVTTAGLISWVIIAITYLRFFRALQMQGITRDSLPYKSPLQPYITYYGLLMNVLVLILSGWNAVLPKFDPSSFFSNYLNCIIFPIAYVLCKAFLRDPVVPLESIDFRTELEQIKEEETHMARIKTTIYDDILNKLF